MTPALLARSLRTDPYPTPDYRVCHTARDFYDYIDYAAPITFLACDTESLPNGSCYCTTISHTPGTGRLIYTDSNTLVTPLSAFRMWLSSGAVHTLLFHNYLHDVIPFTTLSLPIPRFLDTMVLAYHLCLGGGGDDEDSESKAGRGSLGLKTLAYRLCNMRMTSFKDTVYPHSIPYLYSWLQSAAYTLSTPEWIEVCECTHTREWHEARGKTQRRTGKCAKCECRKWKPVKKPAPTPAQKQSQSISNRAGRLAAKILSNPTTDWTTTENDPWPLIRNWGKDDEDSYKPDNDLSLLETAAGPLPMPSIAHVPEPELLHYACRDADATLRLYHAMQTLNPWLFWP